MSHLLRRRRNPSSGLEFVKLLGDDRFVELSLGGLGVRHLGLELGFSPAMILKLVLLALPHEAVRALRHYQSTNEAGEAIDSPILELSPLGEAIECATLGLQ